MTVQEKENSMLTAEKEGVEKSALRCGGFVKGRSDYFTNLNI